MKKITADTQNSLHEKSIELKPSWPQILIPESRGDFADQAQDQIECDINEQIYQIRKRLQSDQKRSDLESLNEK